MKRAVLLCLASMLWCSCLRSPSPSQKTSTGANLFAVNCAICHGATGKGDGVAATSMNPPPPLLDTAFLTSRERSQIETAIRRGVTRSGRQTMPPASELSEQELTILVDYLFELAKKGESRK